MSGDQGPLGVPGRYTLIHILEKDLEEPLVVHCVDRVLGDMCNLGKNTGEGHTELDVYSTTRMSTVARKSTRNHGDHMERGLGLLVVLVGSLGEPHKGPRAQWAYHALGDITLRTRVRDPFLDRVLGRMVFRAP